MAPSATPATLKTGKLLPDRLHAPEASQHLGKPVSPGRPNTSMSMSFDVAPQQPVAHPAADDERAPAGRVHGACDGRDRPC